MALSSDIAALIGFGCEAVLYGGYCVLFIVSLMVLLRRRSSTRSFTNPILLANCLLFLCCTAHFALEFNHYHDTLQNSGVPGYSNENRRLAAADFLISLTDLIGDLVLLYRCWMVWGKNYYIIILPFLSAIAGFACIMEVFHDVLIMVGEGTAAGTPPAALVPLGIAGYVLPLGTNALVTGLIAYRIWYSSRDINYNLVGGSGAGRRALTLIVESGALYLVVQLIFVVLFAMNHPAEAIMAVIAVQTYGIAPTLIIIRVSLGISSEHSSKTMASTHIDWMTHHPDTTGTSATNFTTNADIAADTDIEIFKEGEKNYDVIEVVQMKDIDLERASTSRSDDDRRLSM
ncbi:hypothetical protein BJ138DRAFT_1081397 [Hygrophoropsis aurantiaca]|uniref:Uncharacterized protein n=1 Tax=Hygrophoropsis aurantiaca TaxID=72124 RepID=A0ACB8AKS1_9AGAM|nr:hypothetical protein BJ138DRAFT_1081397 [Hygrophoropsis aurantiaca]